MKTYVLVGVGGRSIMFMNALSGKFKNNGRLLSICDINKGRLELAQKRLSKLGVDVACYLAKDFDRMLSEYKPDFVIICTKDSAHDEYICRSMKAGCDVITEKPMTIDERRCQKIVDTAKQTGKSVRVTFNYRYAPLRSQLKELLMEGVIGKVLSVEFNWMLDTSHGADYFRRWHRNKENSGGLLVHKATHHFDLVNWWLSDIPESVYCRGELLFYNEEQAKRCNLENHGDRCLDCPVKSKCNYYLDMTAYHEIKELYLNCEKQDGYFRDKCVFSNEINIEDSMNVVVYYRSGVILSYSLNAFSPWEGYHIAFNGTKGRLEQHCQESSYISGNGKVQGAFELEGSFIRVYPHFKTPYEVPLWSGRGSHGGGDNVMLNDIFGAPEKDKYLRAADYVHGAYSILVGIAANNSMATGNKILVEELVSGLTKPVFPFMPDGTENIEYVEKSRRF